MKIIKWGTLAFTHDNQNPLIEGWLIEKEPSDPQDATPEELLVGFVITWGQEKFKHAVKCSEMDVFRRIIQKKQAELRAQEKDFVPDGLDHELRKLN